MPWTSLRRRTVNEPLPPQEQQKTTLPYRPRSTTVPGLTPRKSLQSLLGSVRKRGSIVVAEGHVGSASHTRQDILEQTLCADREPSDVDARYSKPSPNPARPGTSASLSQAPKFESPRTFLEALADVIRAPATLFYKEKPRKSEDGKPLINDQTALSVDHTDPSPTKTLSSKKSVRFKPGKSILEDGPRSSPIDIPKPMPALPQMRLATTPLLQYFGRDHPDMIPSGRPRETPVLQSRITFRQAMAEAQERVTKDDLQSLNLTPLGSPLSEFATPSSVTKAAKENPFRDPSRETEFTVKKVPPHLDDEKSASGEASQFPDVFADKYLSETSERALALVDAGSVNTRMATASTTSICHSTKFDSRPSHAFDCAFEPDSLGHTKLLQDLARPVPGVSCTLPSKMNNQVDDAWMNRPTCEDIRNRFKDPGCFNGSSSEQNDPFLDETDNPFDDAYASAMVAPWSHHGVDMDSTQSQGPAPREQSPASVEDRKMYSSRTSEEDPWSSILFLHDSPWSAELALRRGRGSFEARSRDKQQSRFIGSHSSFTDVKSDSEPGVLFPWVSVRGKQHSSGDLSGTLSVPNQPFPKRVDDTLPPPALVPLPSSPDRPSRYSYAPHTDEHGLYPFDQDPQHAGDSVRLPPAYQPYHPLGTSSANASTGQESPGTPESSTLSDIEDQAWTTRSTSIEGVGIREYQSLASNPGSNVGPTTYSLSQIPRQAVHGDTPKAAERLHRFIPRQSNPVDFEESHKNDLPSNFSSSRAGSEGPIVGSVVSRNSRRTNSTEAMKEDEEMCRGIV